MRAVFHVNAADVAAHQAFWVHTLGGESDDTSAIDFPLARIRLTRNPPTGGTKGTAVNHVAFAVPNVRDAVAAVSAAGYPIITREELPPVLSVENGVAFIPPLKTSVAFTMGPDEVKVEFYEVADADVPVAFHHIHFFSPEPEKMKLWYAALFGVVAVDRGHFHALDIPNGFNLTFSQGDAVVPTKGRAIDRVEFDVDDPSRFAQRSLVDPWGTSIEIVDAASS